ncbi:hypothetical protein LINPERPRIM_LOCUS29926 [Linum perenne]
MTKFIREGLDVKVCVLRDKAFLNIDCLPVKLGNAEEARIGILYPRVSEYKKPQTV